MENGKKENIKKFHNYAVKYLDENGHVISYGYATLLDQIDHKPGDIVTTWSGQKIMIDFEL